jgi:hypothetical protein
VCWLSERDLAEAKVRLDRAGQLRQTAILVKRAATDRVICAATFIQAAARARPARRTLAYARLAAIAAQAVRRHGAVTQLQAAARGKSARAQAEWMRAQVRLQSVARGMAARRHAEARRAWAHRVVASSQPLGVDWSSCRARGRRTAVVATRVRGGGAGMEMASPQRKLIGVGVGGGGSEAPMTPQPKPAETGGDQTFVHRVIQLQEMLQERGGGQAAESEEESESWSASEEESVDWETANERQEVIRERYRREVLEPRREIRRAARAAKLEAQFQRMLAAVEAGERRREAAVAAREARAAKRARRVVVLREAQRRKAARAAQGAGTPETGVTVEQGGGGGHVRTDGADSGGICGGVDDGFPIACCDDAGEVARSGGRAAEEQAEAEVAEMCEWAGCGDLN